MCCKKGGYIIGNNYKKPFNIGNIISLCMICENISTKELATKMHLPIVYVSDVRNGRKGLSTDRIEKFAFALNIPRSTLFAGLEYSKCCGWDYKKTLLHLLTEYIALEKATSTEKKQGANSTGGASSICNGQESKNRMRSFGCPLDMNFGRTRVYRLNGPLGI